MKGSPPLQSHSGQDEQNGVVWLVTLLGMAPEESLVCNSEAPSKTNFSAPSSYATVIFHDCIVS